MIPKNTLDAETRAYLQELLSKNAKDLEAGEIQFLNARKDYLTEREFAFIPKEAKVAKKKST